MSNSSEDKDEARDSRLVLRKTNQEVIRKELRANAYKHCVDETKLFADCAKKEGFMVVFKCREVLKTMNNCLDQYCNEDELKKLTDKKIAERRKS